MKSRVNLTPSGLWLIFDKSNALASVLFLEWLSSNKITLEKIVDDKENGRLKIRLFGTKGTYLNAQRYINDNLPGE